MALLAVSISGIALSNSFPVFADATARQQINDLDKLGRLYQDKGQLKKAETTLQRSLHLSEKCEGPTSRQTVNALNSLARVLVAEDNFAAARPLYQRIIAIEQKQSAPCEEIAQSCDHLAEAYQDEQKFDAAETWYKKSLNLRETSKSQNSKSLKLSLNNLANLYKEKGDLSGAVEVAKRAVEVARTEQDADVQKNDLLTNMNNLALLYREQGDKKDTEELFKQVVEIRSQNPAANHGELANNLNNLARFYRDQGRYSEAEPLYKQSLDLREKAFGAKSAEVGATLRNYAILLRKMNRIPEASVLDNRADAIESKISSHPG